MKASLDDSVIADRRSWLFRKAAVANLYKAVPALLRFLSSASSGCGGDLKAWDFFDLLAIFAWGSDLRAVPFLLFFLVILTDIQKVDFRPMSRSSQVWRAGRQNSGAKDKHRHGFVP